MDNQPIADISNDEFVKYMNAVRSFYASLMDLVGSEGFFVMGRNPILAVDDKGRVEELHKSFFLDRRIGSDSCFVHMRRTDLGPSPTLKDCIEDYVRAFSAHLQNYHPELGRFELGYDPNSASRLRLKIIEREDQSDKLEAALLKVERDAA